MASLHRLDISTTALAIAAGVLAPTKELRSILLPRIVLQAIAHHAVAAVRVLLVTTCLKRVHARVFPQIAGAVAQYTDAVSVVAPSSKNFDVDAGRTHQAVSLVAQPGQLQKELLS